MNDFNPILIWYRSYGGIKSVLGSEYFWFAVVLSAFCAPIWLVDCEGKFLWTTYAIGIIPSLLSFSIGGFAIFLAFSHTVILKVSKEDGADDSLYMSVCAKFFHFISVQVITIFFALILTSISMISNGIFIKIFSMIGFIVFAYSIIGVLAIAAALLQMAQLINRDV